MPVDYSPENCAELFLFFAPVVSELLNHTYRPQDLTFIYNLPKGSPTVVVHCPANPINKHPCDENNPQSPAQERYEMFAKRSARLAAFARKNHISYFEDLCFQEP